jgi:hypothetical protein
LAAAVVLGLAVLAMVPGAAVAAERAINGNPLTITAQDSGNLQARQAGAPSNQFYPSESTVGAAGFFLGFPVSISPGIAAGTLYGPASVPAGPSTTGFTPVSQSPVTGAGTSASPFTQISTYKVEGTDTKDYLSITQTIQYVNGTTQFPVTYVVQNVTGGPNGPGAPVGVRFRASEGADPFFSNSDSAIGFHSAPPEFVGSFDPNVATAGGIVQTGPPWSHYQEDSFSTIWGIISNVGGPGFANTVNPNSTDDGLGVDSNNHYNAGQELAPGQSETYSLTWRFGIGLFQLTLTPTSAAATAGQTVQFVAKLTDFNGTPAANQLIRWATGGVNSLSGSVNTNAAGQAVIPVSGGNAGNDTFAAFADLNQDGQREAGEPFVTATIHWNALVVPKVKGVKGGKVKITFDAPSAGTGTLTGTIDKKAKGAKASQAPVTYGKTSFSTTKAGPVNLTLKPNAAGRRALRRKGSLSVTVNLAFRSSAHLGSTTASKNFRVKVHKKHH